MTYAKPSWFSRDGIKLGGVSSLLQGTGISSTQSSTLTCLLTTAFRPREQEPLRSSMFPLRGDTSACCPSNGVGILLAMPRDVHRGHVPKSFGSCLASLKLLMLAKGQSS